MRDFSNKTVVITGGATGIGFSFAKRFGEQGAKVVVAGRRQAKLDEAVASLTGLGIESAGFACDVADYAQVEALADFAEATYGGADAIMNNAGVMIPPSTVIDADLAQIEFVMKVTYFGVWNGVSVFGKRFVARGTQAGIYNVGSENSFYNFVPGMFADESAKHGLHALSDALREEVPDFIDVSFVCPGFVSSEMTAPVGGEFAMDTDRYTNIAMSQILAGEYYVVSHAHNVVRITDRYNEMIKAYETYVPRYEGDDEFDARAMMAKRMAR
jgi:NAD(P)-dependent dehydrogenase (short-subunit alcohol dehydrogenase family)